MPKDNITIWTVDQDMKQLVEYDDRFVIITGPKNKKTEKKPVYAHYSIFNKTVDFLNVDISNGSLKNVVDYLERDREFDLIPVDPGKYTTYQIITGQKKDNIPSMHMRKGSTGKNMRLTDKKADAIFELLDTDKFHKDFLEYIDSDDSEFKDAIVGAVAEHQKIESDTDAYKALREGFDLNSKIIRLSTNKFPERLVCMIKHNFDQIQRGKKFNYSEYLLLAYPEHKNNNTY